MKRMIGRVLGTCLIAAAPCRGAGALRRHDATQDPERHPEWTKPGRTAHHTRKAESAFVQALTRAKWPTTT